MTARLRLPPELWQHPLFAAPVEFSPPATPLAVAQIEARLRRIMRMPSAADTTASAIETGLKSLADWAHAVAEKLPHAPAVQEYRDRHARLQRLATAEISAERAVLWRALQRVLPADWQMFLPPPETPPEEMRPALRFLDFIALDACLRAIPLVRRSYLRRAYKIAAAALQYNATTDTVRMMPVLTWIRHLLREAKMCRASYVDVGCAFAGGAPALAAAARMLRQDDLCAVIHGTDIVPPPPALRQELWKNYRVGIYQANPVARPLPRVYDVIVLANVHRHLDRQLQEQLLDNLGLSLAEGGRLFIHWRFDAARNFCLCLQRCGAALLRHADANLV